MTDPFGQLQQDIRAKTANRMAIRSKTMAEVGATTQPVRPTGSRPARLAGLMVAVLVAGGATTVALMAEGAEPPAGQDQSAASGGRAQATDVQWEPAEPWDELAGRMCPSFDPEPPLDCNDSQDDPAMQQACDTWIDQFMLWDYSQAAEVGELEGLDQNTVQAIEALETDFPEGWVGRYVDFCLGRSAIRYGQDERAVLTVGAILDPLGQAAWAYMGWPPKSLQEASRLPDYRWADLEATVLGMDPDNLDEWTQRLEVSAITGYGLNYVKDEVFVFTSDPIEPRRGTIDGITFWVGQAGTVWFHGIPRH